MDNIKNGEFRSLATKHFDIIGQVLASFNEIQNGLRDNMLQAKLDAEENLRIKQALDNVSGGVTILNSEEIIIYANESVEQLFKAADIFSGDSAATGKASGRSIYDILEKSDTKTWPCS